MALTESTMLELGTSMPKFSLLEPTTGKIVSDNDFESASALVVMFICNHCPYVQRIRDGLAGFGRDYAAEDVAIVAINSNDPENYPDDSPEKMKHEVEAFGYTFPYLFDADQEVAKSFRAACTPEFYVFDKNRRLTYRGQFDSARPRNDEPVTGVDLRRAVDATRQGEVVPVEQIPSVGCNIKWRPDSAPDYR